MALHKLVAVSQKVLDRHMVIIEH